MDFTVHGVDGALDIDGVDSGEGVAHIANSYRVHSKVLIKLKWNDMYDMIFKAYILSYFYSPLSI